MTGDRGAAGESAATGEGGGEGGVGDAAGGGELVWDGGVRGFSRWSSDCLRVLTCRRVLRTDQTKGRDERGRLVILLAAVEVSSEVSGGLHNAILCTPQHTHLEQEHTIDTTPATDEV